MTTPLVSTISERTAWALAALGALVAGVAWVMGRTEWVGPSLVGAFAALAIAFTIRPALRGFAFTAWVLAFVAGSLAYPAAFGTWFEIDLKVLIVPLIQIIMFGMGTTLSVGDFARVLAMPKPVLVGILLQFSVMPSLGFALASGFGFAPEVAAGIVLIGSCPGGVASNLMAFLARGNVALSVTMTACSTLVSPLVTPYLMLLLASQYVAIEVIPMMLSICNMVLVPVLAGLLANRILYGSSPLARSRLSLSAIAVVGIGLAEVTYLFGEPYLGSVTTGVILGLGLVGLVSATKLVVEQVAHGPVNWMDRALPLVSMGGICLIIAIITARSASDLLQIGPLLLLASVTHNLAGYLFGYGAARLAKLDERDCRTVAFEVGMQNGGMATGLATSTLQSVQAAIAPAIFGPWMNVSGSVLATFWRGRPVESESQPVQSVPLEQ